MGSAVEFDIGPLTWVKNEIDQALERAKQSLAQFSPESEDLTQLKFCQTHIHQVTGAIQMVGLDGVTLFSEAIEKLLAAIEKKEIKASTELLDLINRACNSLSRYLEDLMNGDTNVPLRLFPDYEELLRALGQETVSPGDLFFPDLSVRPAKGPNSPVEEARVIAYIKSQRARFQGGLLKWLRGDKSGLAIMLDSLRAIEQTQALPVHRTFWWSSVGFIDGLAQQNSEAGFSVKQLCARIDLQIRRLAEGSKKVAERLLRDILYFIAVNPASSERINELKQAYQLDSYLPVKRERTQSEIELARIQPILRELRDVLLLAKGAWIKYTSGNVESLTQLRDHWRVVEEKAGKLTQPSLQVLLHEIGKSVNSLQGNNVSETMAIELATAMLLAENATENFARLSDQFSRQVQAMTQRLRAVASGQTLDEDIPDISLLDEISRRAQERLLLGQVVHEIQNNLRYIEQVLDAFFRDHSKRDDIPTLRPLLKQVLGALNILSLDKATKLLKICQEQIAKFENPEYIPEQHEQEFLAESLSSLGFYIEAVEHNQSDRDEIIDPILRRALGLPEEVSIPVGDDETLTQNDLASVEASLESEKKQLANLFGSWQQQPTAGNLRNQLRQMLVNIKQDADMVANNALRKQAERAIELFDQAGDQVTPDLMQAVESIFAPKAPVAAPSEEASRMLHASAEALDAELLEVYLEEAQEVLSNVSENLKICREQPTDREALTVVRRGFHTLKGSGRMVGLHDLGEIAWAVEQVLNKWLEEEKPVTPDLLEMLDLAHNNFNEWVTKLKDTGNIAVDANQLLALTKRLRAGDQSEKQENTEHKIVNLAPEVKKNDSINVIEPETESPEVEVVIGSVTLSASLYAILLEEAEQHLQTLARELVNLREHPEPAVRHDFLRASHTLCGIHRTSGFPVIAELSFELEQWLLAIADRHAIQESDYYVIEQTITLLKHMIEGLKERHAPTEIDKQNSDALVNALRSMIQRVTNPNETSHKEAFAFSAAIEKDSAIESSNSEVVELLPSLSFDEIPSLQNEDSPVPINLNFPEEITPKNNEVIQLRKQTLEQPAQLITEVVTEELPETQDDIDEQLLPIFLEEAQELAPLIGNELRAWHSAPDNTDVIQNLGRILHTLKGSARMAGAMRLGHLTHQMEAHVIAAESINPDQKFSLIEALEADFDRVTESLERLQKGDRTPLPLVTEKKFEEAKQESSGNIKSLALKGSALPEMEAGAQKALLRVRADMVDRLVNEAGEVSIARSRIEGEMRSVKRDLLDLTENVIRLRNQLREIEIQAESQMQSKLSLIHQDNKEFDPLEFDRFTRFQELTRMMAESVNDVSTIQQNLLKHLDDTDAALLSQARMNRELQQELMRIRTVPFSSISERLYRILRQTGKELNKKANLEIIGSQVELDRSVLERLVGPLEHLLRNALDHGLEDKNMRSQSGKSEIGEINLNVRQEGNEIAIVLSDDGGGINLTQIRNQALKKGLIKDSDVLADQQLTEFIFAPGFSTASKVTQISGRGIGMDVVRSEITNLGGRIDVSSQLGKGTSFTLYLPLTLAVSQAVLLRAGARVFAVPAAMVEQVRQFKATDLGVVHQAKIVEWQNNQYPFFYLPRLLGDEESMPEAMNYTSVLLLRSGTHRVAVQIDELVGNQEIVVKNIGPQLARVSGIAGATVLGNGLVVLIINPVQLAQRQVVSVGLSDTKTVVPLVTEKEIVALPCVMVVDDSLTVRKITSRLLTREGYQAITAKDGIDGLQVMQETRPDVILLDIEMPRMDGFEFAKNVRGDPKTADIPIIMITSRTADKHRSRAMDIGVNVYLGKPFQEEELLGHITNLVKKK